MSSTSSSGGISTSSTAGAPLVVNGLISGIDTTQVIQALLAGYQAPITDLQNEQTTLNSQASDYRTLNTDMQAVLTAAQSLNTASSWNLMSATTSNSSVATATASPGAQAGTLSFTVSQLAQANTLLSQAGAASDSAVVTTASSVLAATGAGALGLSALSAGSGLSLGSHSIDVTQASAAATLTGSALGSSTTIQSGVNDTFNLDVNGTNYPNVTIAAGTYTPAQLITALNTALSSADAPVSASLTGAGALQLSTTLQGSQATLTASSGDALASLGLSSGASATGTNAVVEVDGNATTLSSIAPGQVLHLPGTGGNVLATVASAPGTSGALISAGDADAALVSTGNGSLGDIVSALNNSGLSLTASVVDDPANGYRLQVAANSTGVANAVSIDSTPFSSGPLASMTTVTAAENAAVTVGGASGYTLQSSSDTFSNLMQGTAITVVANGNATVSVNPDASGEASAVSSFVSAANQALSDINTLAGYNATTKVAGPLMGSAAVQNLQNAILGAFASAAGSSGLGSAAAAGITVNSDGSLTFDKATFESAYSANPQAVSALFTQGGTYAPSGSGEAGQVSFVYANDNTLAGTYPVTISQSATQATDTGATVSGGQVSASETLTIASGGSSVNYAVTSGQSLAAIAAGLNSSFAAGGLSLSAYVNASNQLELASVDYGSGQSFSVSSSAPGPGTTGLGGASANTPVTYSGSDVAGTINGVAASGDGQVLSAPESDPTLNGLSLIVTTPGISSASSIGSFTYTPGLAQQIASIANAAAGPVNGSLTSEINSLTAQANGLNTGIANDTAMMDSQQSALENEFATMESTLGTLKNEGSALSSQIGSLSGF